MQVQALGDKHAWVCGLDEDFLGWGCIKVSIKKIQKMQLMKHVGPLFAGRKRSRSTYEETTNEHKVFGIPLHALYH